MQEFKTQLLETEVDVNQDANAGIPNDLNTANQNESLYNMSRSERKEMHKKVSKRKQLERFIRMIFIFCIPVLLLGVNQIFSTDGNSDTQLTFSLGLGLIIMYIAYFTYLIILLSGCRCCTICCCDYCNSDIDRPVQHLHRIESYNAILNYWSGMTFTYRAEYKSKNLIHKRHSFYHPINSISEFSAIMGGEAHPMLIIIGSYSFAVLIVAIAAEQEIHGFTWSWDVFCELFGCFGIIMIGTFEFDLNSPKMGCLHNIGVAFAACTMIGCILQSVMLYNHCDHDGEYNYKLVLSIGIAVIAALSGAWFFYISSKGDKWGFENGKKPITDENNRELIGQVTKYTYINIISESACIFSAAMSMCMWLMQYEQCRECDGCYTSIPDSFK